MIFKVYYQETKVQVPVRENTQTLYVEAESARDVRKKLQNRNYNIEFIQQLEGEHLEYEQASEHFELEQV
ncbi:DNA-dependent RNA polymerase subunit epsilon [Sporosarcina sp. D27]|uniref:DNA-dependent RNA polymerase subunit epsilon n=1 Tax=Sporosarcina sp. D27 TaxID=1382305 RepID=UPI00046F91B6|nr:DNA-directed RNA polymerase subunit epsilon [Sporosarcina sp. D27]